MTALTDGGTGERILNRELSWLDFNDRVLALAADPAVPLLERLKFLAIFSQNLDEFFQVRVAGLMDQVAAGLSVATSDGRTPAQQLLDIRDRVGEALARAEAIFVADVSPGLAAASVCIESWDQLDEDDRKYLDEFFEDRVFPVLTPLAVDPGHPFPYISHLSLNLAVIVRDPVNGQRRFARVKVPPNVARFVALPDGVRFVPLEQVIAAHLDHLFPGMAVESHHSFRVTRNADLTLEEEEADDLLEAVEMELRRRRFRRAVRLEVEATATEEVRVLLVRELDLSEEDVYLCEGPLDLADLWALQSLDRPDLKFPLFAPITPAPFVTPDDDKVDLFAELRAADVLVHHPYDSFTATVEEFVRQAAADPDVLAIKLTLYRTSGDSLIVKSLIRAAERGKQVAVLVELKARGDEQANIEWARALEEAGVHVVYGLVGLKTHTKIALVVRAEPDGLRRYCHIGTGNYNPSTARIYDDIGLLTADDDLGDDLTHLFNYLTGYARDVQYHQVLVAPRDLRTRLLALVAAEVAAEGAAGPGRGRIIAKMNSLVDDEMIEALYAASAAGVEIDLIVRGICCLRPGVPGLSENIRVRSIVGRYLEHGRIFFFANGEGEGVPAWFIGSADLMPRNLDRRVEVLAPVTEPQLRRRLADVVRINLADNQLAWTLGPDAQWRKAETGDAPPVNTHLALQQLAVERARRPS